MGSRLEKNLDAAEERMGDLESEISELSVNIDYIKDEKVLLSREHSVHMSEFKEAKEDLKLIIDDQHEDREKLKGQYKLHRSS